MTYAKTSPKNILIDLFKTAVRSASPENCLPEHLASIIDDKICVVAVGKSAALMARTAEQFLQRDTYGLALTPYNHAVDCQTIEVVEAAHPVPDNAGVIAAQKILNTAEALSSSDFVLCLISGGASSLLTLPANCLTLEQKRTITQELLKSGANIEEMNCVRKHLSLIKGGRLMSAIHPAKALTLCVSDVVGNDPAIIGSGPTVADSSTCEKALEIIRKYSISCPETAIKELKSGELETPKPGDTLFQNSRAKVIASADIAIEACVREAHLIGISTSSLGSRVEGDSNAVATDHAQMVLQFLRRANLNGSHLILSGGETTVSVSGKGKGGPNTQYALALAIELNGTKGIYAIACDTDGRDGAGDNAGAVITPTTLERAKQKNLDPQEYLENNDSYSFFESLGDLVKTGPTLTNVNDYRAILYLPEEAI